MRNNRGFTLIELMVTIAVLAIIVAMAVPFFGDMLSRQNLNKSAQELVSIMNEARAKAVLERRVITVNLRTTNVADTNNQLNWKPTGNAVLRSGNPTVILFGITGGVFIPDPSNPPSVIPATTDTSFMVCDTATGTNRKSKTITVSRMGTIQMIAEGACS